MKPSAHHTSPFHEAATANDMVHHFFLKEVNVETVRLRRSRQTIREKRVLAESLSQEDSGRFSLLRQDGYAESGAPGRLGVSNSPNKSSNWTMSNWDGVLPKN
jgi:hypothetical protein